MEALGLVSLESLSTDQLIDFMMHESLDGNSWLADSYRDFYCRNVSTRLRQSECEFYELTAAEPVAVAAK